MLDYYRINELVKRSTKSIPDKTQRRATRRHIKNSLGNPDSWRSHSILTAEKQDAINKLCAKYSKKHLASPKRCKQASEKRQPRSSPTPSKSHGDTSQTKHNKVSPSTSKGVEKKN